MKNNKQLNNSSDRPLEKTLKEIARDLRRYIELSVNGAGDTWKDWQPAPIKDVKVRCWEKENCHKKSCPAYQNPEARCWLITGTLCGGRTQGEFSSKYAKCTECNVYVDLVHRDPVIEISEHLVTLIHSLGESHNKLKIIAIKDSLTDLYNRNYLNEIIKSEVEKVKRYKENTSIIMIDLNDFKKTNDIYGHLHGDFILQECAKILKKSTRKSDFVFRYGGDEFLIIASRLDCIGSNAIIERIDQNVSKWNLENEMHDCKLSISCGCSELTNDKDYSETIKEADAAMYKNKNLKKQQTA